MATNDDCELSILMPCLNESETLEVCIRKAQQTLRDLHISGEVLIADNGSTDDSQNIAARLGARVVHVETKGYGAALKGGIAAAQGKFIIMGDADDSYDFSDLGIFVEKLRAGYDLIMGNRFKGGIKPGAMRPLHKYLGNPVLTTIGRVFFYSPCGDFHCGLRGFSKDAIMRMNLRTTGMEFASEMVVKAVLLKMRIAEVPIILYPDGRSRPPHLRSWRDGWRHLRFLLLYSPRWLFMYPGMLFMILGGLVGFWLLSGPKTVGHITLGVHALLYAALAVIIGFQAVIFYLFTKVFAVTEGFLPQDQRLNTVYRYVTLEIGLLFGGVFILIGCVSSFYVLNLWKGHFSASSDPLETLRMTILAITMIMLGCQTILSSFFLSVLGLKRQE